MEPNTHNEIALALATHFGFECRIHGISRYAWTKHNTGIQSPRIPNDATKNPCAEIPLDYEIYIRIDGDILDINSRCSFNLNDPKLIEKLTEAFSDLDKLRVQLDGPVLMSEVKMHYDWLDRMAARHNYINGTDQ